MVGMTLGPEPLAAQVGRRVHIQLVDGQRLEGTLARVDARTGRLRPTGRAALVVVSRRAVTAIDAVAPIAA